MPQTSRTALRPTIDTSPMRTRVAEPAPLTAAAAYAIESAAYYDQPRQSLSREDGYRSPTEYPPYDANHQSYDPYSGRRLYYARQASIDEQHAAYGGYEPYDDAATATYGNSQHSHHSLSHSRHQHQPIAYGAQQHPIARPDPGVQYVEEPGALLYDPDYVIAMHDYVPQTPSATCLSFRAGEVIHVLNRDATGWWDGELDGRRGWFPSNYISTDVAAFAAAAELAGLTLATSGLPVQVQEQPQEVPASSRAAAHVPSSASGGGRTKSPSRKSHRSRRGPRAPSPVTEPSDLSESVTDRRGSCPPLMVPMVHALALLQNAVKANRVAHFQPSTACVISCVRSVLSTCECLTKDSPHLERHPKLAQQRKKVLSELAHLVGKARTASEVGTALQNAAAESGQAAPAPDPQQLRELQDMVRVGDQVYAQVRRFLAVAVEAGVDLPPDRLFANAPGLEGPGMTPSSSEEDHLGGRNGNGNGNGHAAGSPPSDGSLSSTSEAELAPRAREPTASTYRPERTSVAPSRSSVAYDDEPFNDGTPRTPQSNLRMRTSSSQKRLSFRGVSATPPHNHHRASPREASAPYRKPKYSISSVSSLSSWDSSHPGSDGSGSGSGSDHGGAYFPSGVCTTTQALAALRTTHDRLLSVIAAFIGHIHSHSRSSHASSKGHLIEMTRKTVDQVRYLLTLVDAVEEHPVIGETKPREMAVLKSARFALYKSTNDIVEAVREMMSPTSALAEEDEKTAALQAATGTLRAGGDCVKAVNMCLSMKLGEEPFMVQIAPVPSTDSPTQTSPTQTSPPSISSSRASSSPPSTPKSIGFKRTHAYSKSQPDAMQDQEPPSASVGGRRSGGRRRAQSDASPLRSDGSRRPSNDFVEDAREDVGGDGPEGEDTVRFEKARTRPSLPSPKSPERDDLPQADTLTESEDEGEPVVPAVVISNANASSESLPHVPPRNDDIAKLSSSVSSLASPRSSLDAPLEGRLSTSSSNSSTFAVSGEMDDSDHDRDSTAAASEPTVVSPSDENGVEATLEEKLMRGELPATPSAPAEFVDAVYDPRDLLVNDSQQVVAASLEVMVIKMTPMGSTPDRAFVVAFLLTFRLFTTPAKLVTALAGRWNAQPGVMWPAAERQEFEANLPFMRIRVAVCIKTWLENFWITETDDEVLPQLQQFLDQSLPPEADKSLTSIVNSTRGVIDSETARARRGGPRPMDRSKAPAHLLPGGVREGVGLPGPASDMPAPIFNKRTGHSRLGTMDAETPITDLEPLEVARQLTLVEARLFNDVPARELVELGKAGAKSDRVKAISTFSTATTGWVSESILNEQDQKKRATLIKYFIKLADRCLGLHNYSTMRAILAALDSSTISRLTKTWSHISAKYKVLLDAMRRLSDHAKNYAVYREALRQTNPPAVPFLGLYLTDLTFCREGNPSNRPSPLDPNRQLVNFNKYFRLARIVQDVQRFQSTPFNLQPVQEIQKYLSSVIEKSKNTGDLQDLYRRSLVLEPRQPSDAVPPDSKPGLLGWASRG